jgi:hypothetical protein
VAEKGKYIGNFEYQKCLYIGTYIGDFEYKRCPGIGVTRTGSGQIPSSADLIGIGRKSVASSTNISTNSSIALYGHKNINTSLQFNHLSFAEANGKKNSMVQCQISYINSIFYNGRKDAIGFCEINISCKTFARPPIYLKSNFYPIINLTSSFNIEIHFKSKFGRQK